MPSPDKIIRLAYVLDGREFVEHYKAAGAAELKRQSVTLSGAVDVECTVYASLGPLTPSEKSV